MSKATLERRQFVEGLYGELNHQFERYSRLATDLHHLLGRMEIAEETVKIARDHFRNAMEGSQEEVPEDWQKLLSHVRFVGMRTADACLEVLRERNRISTDDLLFELNAGCFRFSSPYPLREINASLMRHPHVKRDGDEWIYEPPAPKIKERPLREVFQERAKKAS